MWPTIRYVGFLDILVSFFYIAFVVTGFYNVFRNGEAVGKNSTLAILSDPKDEIVNSREDARWHVFNVLTHVLLILRFVSSVVLLGSSFKTEFKKQFKACAFWMFISLVTMTIEVIELCICNLHVFEIVVCALEICFRIVCGVFIVNFMRYDSDQEQMVHTVIKIN